MSQNKHLQPLVSCIMPTHNRRWFIPLSIRYFQRQDYECKELIIIDDGMDDICDLVPADERIHYHRLDEKMTLGAKLNMACELARGAIIVNWDDDDWYAQRRISYQVVALKRDETNLCGINDLLYFDIRTYRAYRYVYPHNQRLWLLGSSLCYTKSHWEKNPFADIDVGMDGYFVWGTAREEITVLEDSTFAVFMAHDHNVSPKDLNGTLWQPYPAEKICQILGDDWFCYQPKCPNGIEITEPVDLPIDDKTAKKPLCNIFACLVHENQESIIDLVRNLNYHDPTSIILLYNGGEDENLLKLQFPFNYYGAIVHPSPHPMTRGKLHMFAIDCMKFALENFQFDMLTIVDSDQLLVKTGYSDYLGNFLSKNTDLGLLGNSPECQGLDTNVATAARALKEIDLWRPILRHFGCKGDSFLYWTFWPSTVFLLNAVRDLIRFYSHEDALQKIINDSTIWATEEVVLPTLVALLGHKIGKNPCSYDYVRYQTQFSIRDINSAFDQSDVFWLHPIPRQYANPLRCRVRNKFNNYQGRSVRVDTNSLISSNNSNGLLMTLPILKAMNKIHGWLEEEEADLLIAASRNVMKELTHPHSIVEIGSFKGRSTVVLGSVVKAVCPEAKIYAIDPHDGKVGAMDQSIQSHPPTLNEFNRNIENAGLRDVVKTVQSRSVDVLWDSPISFLFIDGLHDYPNVARDFWHFHKSVRPGGIVAFHDYAEYYPGVMTFVNELIILGECRFLNKSKNLVVLKKNL